MIPTVEVITDVRADDVIVVRYPGEISDERAKKIQDDLSALWGCHVLVMGNAPSLTVIKPSR